MDSFISNKNDTFLYFSFFLALFIFIQISVFNTNLQLFSDENSYYYSAMNISKFRILTNDREGSMYRGEIPPNPSLDLMPGFPLYLNIVLNIFDNDILKIRIINILWASLLFIYYYKYLILFKINRFIILISLSFYVLYPGYYYNTARILTENIFSLMIFSGSYHIIISNSFNLTKREKISNYILGNILLIGAIYVRPHAVPICIFFIFLSYIISSNDKFSSKNRLLISIILICIPETIWVIRNFMISNKLILLSSSGEAVKIWGTIPYFLDINSTSGYSSKDLHYLSFSYNSILYICWRIFGFIQYMWGDIWDEYLVHKYKYTGSFFYIHHFLLIPLLIISPLHYASRCIPFIFISLIPMIFTLINMPYHGLPRYVWPSIPFIFIIFSYTINMFYKKSIKSNEYENYLSELNIPTSISFCRKSIYYFPLKLLIFSIFFLSLIFSIILFISVFIFPPKIKQHMSEYRLNKYRMTTINKVINTWDEVYTYNINNEKLYINNSKLITSNCYKGDKEDPMLLDIDIPNIVNNFPEKNIISKVTINGHGGRLFDYMTIYWNSSNNKGFNENTVYRFPTRFFDDSQTIYIDSNITNLIIVPTVFKNGNYCINSIEIKKYSNKYLEKYQNSQNKIIEN